MSKLVFTIIVWLLATALGTGARAFAEPPGPDSGREISAAVPDSEQLEKGLQSLSWEQFRSVVNSIPKLKADVDAYGPLGWQYVQSNYRTYHWRKNINKLHADQKIQLAGLIRDAREGSKPAN